MWSALLWPAHAAAQVHTVLKSFGIWTNITGSGPSGQLARGGDGSFYGTTSAGEGSLGGTVFKVQGDGTGFTVLRFFTNSLDGAQPSAGLLEASGTLYGTAYRGGNSDVGTVFRLNTDGSGFAVLKHFSGSDGQRPRASVVRIGATLYGTTSNGGTSGLGTVFRLNTNGTGYGVLVNFTDGNGAGPHAGLASSGVTLYGTTWGGGSAGHGAIYKVNTDGTGFTLLKSFSGADGSHPEADLVLINTVLYGTTYEGGAAGLGTVFRVNTDGTGYAVLRNFAGPNDGAYPYAGLIFDGATLYGTTGNGGSLGLGTVFKLSTDGTGYSIINNFVEVEGGAYWPQAALVLSEGTLYGTTYQGGTSGAGTIFKVNTNGTGYTVLKHLIASSDGSRPAADLLLSGNTLFGTTTEGGASFRGTVFKVNTDGSSYTLLKQFAGSAEPRGSLVLSDGALYGTTVYGGGPDNYGTVFKVNTNGSGYSVLKNFTGADGANPWAGLVLSGSTLLYGTTSGTVFKLNTDGTGYAVLKNFSGSDGGGLLATLLLDGAVLYGTTSEGGATGNGTVFKLNTNGTGFTVLKSFAGYPTDGRGPSGRLVLSGSTLYGATEFGGIGNGNNGTVFKIHTDGSGYAVLRNLTGYPNGGAPTGPLVLNGGTLFGTAKRGGSSDLGAIFMVRTDGTGYRVLASFSRANGANPNAGLLWSEGRLLGTTYYGGDLNLGVVFSLDLRPTITVIQTNSPGTFQATGFPGVTYGIEASTNLMDWLLIANQTAGTNGLLQFSDWNHSNYPRRFYRTRVDW